MPLTQSTIKFISSLRQKKFRQSYHKFTVEGTKIVGELLTQTHYRIADLYVLKDSDFIEAMRSSNSQPGIVPITVTEKELHRISQLTTPNQVVAVVHLPEHSNALPPDLSTQWSIYLDGIQSPANLGAILRVADWFGFTHVFGGPGTADLYNSKSIQASMGTFLRVNYQEAELEDILSSTADLEVFAADLTGENIFQFESPAAGILVIGNEGKGIRTATRALVTQYLSIPRAAGRKAESLNAAVATGILCGQLLNNSKR